MKRIICLLLACIGCIFLLASCDTGPVVGEFTPLEEITSARFQLIGKEALADHIDSDVLEHAYYYVDRYTNIIYVYVIDWDANATRGMMTVLYNAEGNLMTLDEFEKEIK